MRKILFFLPLVIMLFSFTVLAQVNGIDPWKNRTVISVIDGDTVVLDNGEVVRMIGVLTPKAKHGKQEGQPLGEQARNLTEELILGKQIEIYFDKAFGPNGHRDKYGRALAYISLSKGLEILVINQELLKLGAGYLADIPEECSYARQLKSAEFEARKRKVGVWTQGDKSPQEVAQDQGKPYEEPLPTVQLIYVRPTVPILQGPGITPEAVASNNTPTTTPTTPRKPSTSLSMDDVTRIPQNPNANKQPATITRVIGQAAAPEDIYELKERAVIYTAYDNQAKLEIYRATTLEGKQSYRIGIKEGDKEYIVITNLSGVKSFQGLVSKGTESQPSLSSVEASLGSLSGDYGSAIIASTGKDGGLNLNVTGKDGKTRFYLSRPQALKLDLINP